jgi:hypothetical protein
MALFGWGNSSLAFAAITGLVIWVIHFGLSMAADRTVNPK